MVVVAQLVRASVCGTEGRGFESRLPPHLRHYSEKDNVFFFCNTSTYPTQTKPLTILYLTS